MIVLVVPRNNHASLQRGGFLASMSGQREKGVLSMGILALLCLLVGAFILGMLFAGWIGFRITKGDDWYGKY